MLSLALHTWRTPGNEQAIWIATEEELHDIAAPLSRIVARRVPEGLASGDVGDGMELATATAAYAIRGVSEEALYKATRAGAPAPAPPPADTSSSSASNGTDAPEPPPASPYPVNLSVLEQMGRA